MPEVYNHCQPVAPVVSHTRVSVGERLCAWESHLA